MGVRASRSAAVRPRITYGVGPFDCVRGRYPRDLALRSDERMGVRASRSAAVRPRITYGVGPSTAYEGANLILRSGRTDGRASRSAAVRPRITYGVSPSTAYEGAIRATSYSAQDERMGVRASVRRFSRSGLCGGCWGLGWGDDFGSFSLWRCRSPSRTRGGRP